MPIFITLELFMLITITYRALLEAKNTTLDVWKDHRLIELNPIAGSQSHAKRNLIQEILSEKFGSPIDLSFGFCKEKGFGFGDKTFGASFAFGLCDTASAKWPYFGIPKMSIITATTLFILVYFVLFVLLLTN